MFVIKSALIIAILALCNLVAAFPPACLVGAVNTQPKPADLKTICGSANVKVQNELVKICGDTLDDGLDAFKNVCAEAGYQIKLIDTATISPSGTGSVRPTGTGSGSPTTTGEGESPSGSGNGPSPTESGNAGHVNKYDSMLMAIALGLVGAAAAL
ncbi:hypothetical protein FQN57_006691 [Myotisia sp. PD_48]|nr:hypothetical protein FQN57_006691 [Myotisia sp. PD_48]